MTRVNTVAKLRPKTIDVDNSLHHCMVGAPVATARETKSTTPSPSSQVRTAAS